MVTKRRENISSGAIMDRPVGWILVLMMASLLSSCAPPIYLPNPEQVPFFSQQGEAQLGASTGTNTFSVNLGASFERSTAVIANTNYHSSTDDTSQIRHQRYSEFGVGYYWAGDQTARFEIYAGAGIGSVDGRKDIGFSEPDIVEFEGKYRRYFIQADGGTVMAEGQLEAGPVVRLAYVDFYEYSEHRGAVPRIPTKPLSSFFFEPGVMARLGSSHFRIEVQGGISTPQKDVQFDWELFFGYVGFKVVI